MVKPHCIKNVINNKTELKPLWKQLHNYSTSAEAVLWTHLQKSQLQNRKFRRQHSIGNFIADFYCLTQKLVIELDGEDHFWDAGIGKDRIEENYLKSIGIKVIRFENKWVYADIAWVLEKIKAEFNHPWFYASHKIGPLFEKAGETSQTVHSVIGRYSLCRFFFGKMTAQHKYLYKWLGIASPGYARLPMTMRQFKMHPISYYSLCAAPDFHNSLKRSFYIESLTFKKYIHIFITTCNLPLPAAIYISGFS